MAILPLLFTLLHVSRRAERNGALAAYKSPFEQLGTAKLAVALFWQLDVIGIVLVIASKFSYILSSRSYHSFDASILFLVFALVLVPFTIAGAVKDQWQSAHIIVMIGKFLHVTFNLIIPKFASSCWRGMRSSSSYVGT